MRWGSCIKDVLLFPDQLCGNHSLMLSTDFDRKIGDVQHGQIVHSLMVYIVQDRTATHKDLHVLLN